MDVNLGDTIQPLQWQTWKEPRSPPATAPQGFRNSALGGGAGSLRLWLSVSRDLVRREREKINSGVKESSEMIPADPHNPLSGLSFPSSLEGSFF